MLSLHRQQVLSPYTSLDYFVWTGLLELLFLERRGNVSMGLASDGCARMGTHARTHTRTHREREAVVDQTVTNPCHQLLAGLTAQLSQMNADEKCQEPL